MRRWGWAVLAVVAACGTKTNDASTVGETVFVRSVEQVFAPDCVAKADPTEPMLAKGSLDLALASEYRAWLLIGNRAQDDAGAPGGKIAKVSSADVTMFDLGAAGQPVAAKFSVDASGVVDPANTHDPGYGVAGVPLVPAAVINTLRTQWKSRSASMPTTEPYELRFVLRGAFVDGGTFSTAEFRFAVDVCLGCSITFPPDAVDVTYPTPNCLKTSPPTFLSQTACLLGQDGTTDCRSCARTPECVPCSTSDTCPSGSKCGADGVCHGG